jgi:MFS family permease
MVYAGSIGMVLCIMMISLCHSFWQFLLSQGVLLGICMALATWPMVALVGQYFKRSRAAATGFVVAGSSLGGIVWPIVIDRLLNTTSIGFPWTMRIIGFIMIPCLIFSCVAAKSPETVSKSNYQEASETSDKQPTTEKDPKHDRNSARKVLYQQSSMQLTCLAMFLVYFGLFAPIFYLPSFATDQGFSTTLAFYTASIVNGASFLGRILPGFVADKYGKFNCCIVATIFSGIIILCWTRATSVAGLVIWSTAYGFASGVSFVVPVRSYSVLTPHTQGILSLQQACAAQLATPSTIGLAIGSVTGSTALS